jgi:UDP-N-acetylmuramoyl-tripeptide--D-alanyl-D-alanine ligase
MFSLSDILRSTGGKLLAGPNEEFFPFTSASIDSRKIDEGQLFVPLKGAHADGHDFIGQALSKGRGALTEKNIAISSPLEILKNKALIKVEDALLALQRLARFIRLKRPGMPVLGITGSNGKTTTKELTAAVLGSRFNLLKSEGNLNNHIGLPLNLTRLAAEHHCVVLEMGASIPGDIRTLCEIAIPTHAIFTNIGESHLDGFGSMEALIQTKLALAEGAQFVIYNADDPLLAPAVRQLKGKILIGFGLGEKADVKAENITFNEKGSAWTLARAGESIKVRLNIPGAFNIYNALASAAAGVIFDVPFNDIRRAFESFVGVPMRYEIEELRGVLILNDIYNANPASMREAIRELLRLRRGRGKGRAVAVLGDMLELGPFSEEAHREIGRSMKNDVDVFIGVGPMMELALREYKSNGNSAILCTDSEEAGRALVSVLSEGDVVLIKGSRGIKMERVLEGYKGEN